MDLFAVVLGAGASTAVVTGVVQLILWRLNRRAAREDKKEDGTRGIQKALQVILYDRIKYLCRKHIAAGLITLEDLEDLLAMHVIYHDDLQGNGFLDRLIDQAKHLPIAPGN